MLVSDYLANALLDLVFKNTGFTGGLVRLSLHDGDPGKTGANEVAGGSYARVQVVAAGWNAATGGLTDNNGIVTFTGMPVVGAPGIVAVGAWDAASSGNFLIGGYLGNHAWKGFSADDTTGELIKCAGHGYSAGHTVIFNAGDGGVMPGGVTAGTVYYVIASGLTADVFSVSATSGGAAVNITSVGQGLVRRIEPKQVANAGDSVQFAIGDVDWKLF